jgi:hypothetical protein
MFQKLCEKPVRIVLPPKDRARIQELEAWEAETGRSKRIIGGPVLEEAG